MLPSHPFQPEFQEYQGPQAVGVVELSRFVLLDQLAQSIDLKPGVAAGRGGEERVAGERPQGAAKPVVQRYAKAHLRTLPDGPRQQLAKSGPEQSLAPPAAEFQLHRQGSRELDQVMIEQRLPAFQPVGHRRNIDLGHQVAGEIGGEVGQRSGRDRIPSRRPSPRRLQECKRVARRQLFEEFIPVQFGPPCLVEDRNPFEVAACRWQGHGGREPLPAAEQRFLAGAPRQTLPEGGPQQPGTAGETIELIGAVPAVGHEVRLEVVRSGTDEPVVGAVVAEWVGGDKGLGVLINLARGSMFDIPLMFAALLTIAAIGVVLYLVVVLLERRLVGARA